MKKLIQSLSCPFVALARWAVLAPPKPHWLLTTVIPAFHRFTLDGKLVCLRLLRAQLSPRRRPEPWPGGWAKWTPEIETAGDYQIYLLWTSCQKRAGDVPIEVRHQNGTDTGKCADQTRHGGANGSMWALIPCPQRALSVKISAENAGYTIADAAKIRLCAAGCRPGAPRRHAPRQRAGFLPRWYSRRKSIL